MIDSEINGFFIRTIWNIEIDPHTHGGFVYNTNSISDQ